MNIFLITLGAMAVFLFLMAVGVIFSHIKVHGSCGGLNNVTGDSCMFCKGEDQCREEAKKQQIPVIKLKDYNPSKS
jgi:hypothetical protein